MSDFPCKNPSCSSYGKPHANCKCGPGSNYAEGGQIMKEYYCSKENPHDKTCQYFAEGGGVDPNTLVDIAVPPPSAPPEDIDKTLGHAATHHGLLGILKDVGHAALAKSEKHAKLLHEAKAGTNKLGAYLANNDHEKAAEHMQGHTMIGNVAKSHLAPIMHRLSGPIKDQEPNPEALRSSVDYLHSSIKGHDSIESHMTQMYDSKKMGLKPDQKGIESLKKHLDDIQEDPTKALDAGGTLGHYLPDHAAAVGNLTAVASNYFQSLKPIQSQGAPLDRISPVDKMAEAKYDRQLGIAQNPLLVLQHAKDGTLQEQDLMTLHTLYPKLAKDMTEKAQEQLVAAKAKGLPMTYKQKQGISMLMGAPLDSTMTQASMQAIIQANSPKQAPPTPGKGGNQKATKTAIEQSNKVTALYETPLQSRQINKKD